MPQHAAAPDPGPEERFALLSPSTCRDVKENSGAIPDERAEKVPPRAVRWFQPDGMHMNLRILGETEIMVLTELQRELDQSAGQYKLQLHGYGCSANGERQRVS